MRTRLRSWWQQIRAHPVVAIIVFVVSALGLALVVVLVLGYIFNWGWTGLGLYIPPTKDSNFQRGKTLWDWLQLLIIPFIFAIGGFWFSQIQKSRDERDTKLRDTTEREIAADYQREAALQAYLDKMSELLLHENLRDSTEEDEVRKIGRVRTLTILLRLDDDRKKSVLQFLRESQLIDKDKTIVNLEGADLSRVTFLSTFNLTIRKTRFSSEGRPVSVENRLFSSSEGATLNEVDLSGANLSEANLSMSGLIEANLSRANLGGADLVLAILNKANLSRADLKGADLRGADLSGANLSGADLRGADLSCYREESGTAYCADLRGADLSGANLKGISGITVEELESQAKSLKGATMPDGKMYRNSSGVDLSYIDLYERDLSGVDLTGAILFNVNLMGTNLEGANLSKAWVTREQVEQARTLKGATMPDGSIHP